MFWQEYEHKIQTIVPSYQKNPNFGPPLTPFHIIWFLHIIASILKNEQERLMSASGGGLVEGDKY